MNKIDLYEFLKNYRDRNIMFCPNPGNVGDALLALAAYQLFDELKFDYTVMRLHQSAPQKIIFYGGGGNLIEGVYSEAFEFIAAHIEDSEEMVILPHTIFGYEDFFCAFANKLTIICREKESYLRLQLAGFPQDRLYITHDLSLLLDRQLLTLEICYESEQNAYCFRTDDERTNIELPQSNFDVSLTWNGALWHNKGLAKHAVLSLANYLNAYENIHTNRLHVAILGALIGKSIFLYPNCYFKNSAVYHYSLKNKFPNIHFVKKGKPTVQQLKEFTGRIHLH